MITCQCCKREYEIPLKSLNRIHPLFKQYCLDCLPEKIDEERAKRDLAVKEQAALPAASNDLTKFL
jgi:hypothetical protein